MSKLKRKNFDAIVLNSLRDEGAGFSGDTNTISIIFDEKTFKNFDLKSKDAVAKDIVRRAIGQVFNRRMGSIDTTRVTEFFDADNNLKVPDTLTTEKLSDVFAKVPGLIEAARVAAEGKGQDDLAAAAEFVLEGLYARKQVSRSEERGYGAAELENASGGARKKWN